VKATDLEFARLALSRGWIHVSSHDAALREADRCQALGLDKSVEDVLLDEGSLSAKQVRSIREELGLALSRPRIGNYEILRRVGMGGMGTVFEATHLRLKQRVALKVLLSRLSRDPALSERFLLEARTLARLKHPHLVHAIDAGLDGDTRYLAMEFVDGENVLQALGREGPMEIRRALGIVLAVCKALVTLEEEGLVHRDVKPANILLGTDGSVKLGDLGLLKTPLETLNAREPIVCGTPHYVSPEQVRREESIDSRSDIYSLGATWYQMLTQKPLFPRRTTAEVLRAHLSEAPLPPSLLRRGIPRKIERVLLGWLAKDRNARPRSALAALEELRDCERCLEPIGRRLAGLFLGRARHGAGGRVSRRADSRAGTRRRRLLLGGLLLVLVLVLAGLGVWWLIPGGEAPLPAVAPLEDKGTPDSARAPEAGTPPAPIPLKERPRLPAALVSVAAEEARARAAPPLPTAMASRPDPRPETRILAGVGRHASRMRDVYEEWLRRGLEATGHLRAAHLPLVSLERSFHATRVAIDPRGLTPRDSILVYEFDAGSELLDFRAPAGTWAISDGALHSASDPPGESLESLAWFVPPVVVECELRESAPVILGFGRARLSPGRGDEEARAWVLEPGADDVSILVLPLAPKGSCRVEFREGLVRWRIGGRSGEAPLDVPASGRLVLRLGKDRSLNSVEVRARLEPNWSEERRRILESRGR
jgi:serine/threonine-protein kinase